MEKKAIQPGNKMIKRGTLFLIPIKDKDFALGQVVDFYHSAILVIVFAGKLNRYEVPADYIKIHKIEIMGLTFDALLKRGTWAMIGNQSSNLDEMPKPEFLIGPPERCEVEDIQGEIIRSATQEDLRRLDYRTIVSPMIIQDAVQALHGIVDWDKDFESLRYKRCGKP